MQATLAYFATRAALRQRSVLLCSGAVFDGEQKGATWPCVMQAAQLRVGPADRVALELVHAGSEDGDLPPRHARITSPVTNMLSTTDG